MQEPRIIAVTQPRISAKGLFEGESRVLTPSEFITYTARVSNPDNQMNTETAPKLLKYLMKHGHWSPFQMVSLTMEIHTTRDVAHQMIRHWSFDDVGTMNVQEFSQRYAEVHEGEYDVRECRMQDPKNRQGSTPANMEDTAWWEYWQRVVMEKAWYVYKTALAMGIAKEVARAVLPEGLTLTTLYVSGTMRSWIHYCAQRTQNDVQREHRDLARACWKVIGEEFPDLKELITWAE